ncbi:MAG: O-antigen ligase family protein [Thermomicrobia bacterium]|nr:O-antigen ligase family protein [Thermomicrobia bacterium]MCA1724955.1 O-antigen ligase family protein [Thermomicrobia bacterium]
MAASPSVPHIPLAMNAQWRRWLWSPGLLAGGAIAAGSLGGALAITVGPVLPLAFLIAILGVVAILLDARVGLYAAVAVIALLPYATLPVKVVLTFTLLEAVILLTIAVWILRLGFDRSELIITTPVFLPLGFFITATLVAFLVGAGRNTTTQTAHDYLKLLLAVGMIVLVVNLLRERRDVAWFTTALVAGGAIAGVIAIVLQRLPVALTTRLLVRLSVVGYPTSRVVRYIEDNPALARRATGTGVDPNAFAGFLMLVLVLAVGQVVASRPLVARKLAVVTVPVTGLALLLTQSRAAWLGAAVGIGMLAALRYRGLIVPLIVLGIAAAVFGVGAGYLARLTGGLRGQDAATHLRYREYANALQLIRDYPVLGVGFGDAPRIDLQTGVSSVYLTIAERAGLIGLALFLIALVSLLARLIRGALRAAADEPCGELTLAVAASLVAASMAATLDHYFFNLGFPHMAALFWTFAGLGEVALRFTTHPFQAAARHDPDARPAARSRHRR